VAFATRLHFIPRISPLGHLAIDSKLRGCDVVSLKIVDVAPHDYALDRASVRQRKTGRPVRALPLHPLQLCAKRRDSPTIPHPYEMYPRVIFWSLENLFHFFKKVFRKSPP
jgi:hypothetical protein